MAKKKSLPAGILIALALFVAAFAALFVHLQQGEEEEELQVVAAKSLASTPTVDVRAQMLAKRGAAVAGRVVDEEGAGIAGARVCAKTSSWLLSTKERDHSTCVDADPAGHFQIEGLWALEYFVSAAAPTYIAALHKDDGGRSGVKLAMDQTVSGIDIVLRGGAVKISGVALDVSGGVVDGALVEGSGGGGAFFFGGGVSVPVVSDEEGRFELWVEPGNARVSGTADGYAEASDRGPAPGHGFELYFTPESVLVGRVVEAGSGAPVEGARVHANGDWERSDEPSTFTDARGRFRLGGLSPGDYKPSVDHSQGFGMAAEVVGLGLGQTSESIVIEMHPAFSVTGAVVYADSGEPCDDPYVILQDKVRGLEKWGTPQGDGNLVFSGMLPGAYRVSLGCPKAVSRDEYDEVVVEDASLAGVRWEVDQGFTILGRVEGPSGEGLDGISIRAEAHNATGQGIQAGGWANSEVGGTFEVDGLTPGLYAVSVNSWGRRSDFPLPKDPIEVEVDDKGNADEVVFTLEAGANVTGRVIDENNDPVAGVSVQASGQESSWGRGATTADDGSFEIKGLRAGRYRVYAQEGWRNALRAPGRGDDDLQGTFVELQVGDSREVELVVQQHTGTITGVVVDEGGGPVADAFLTSVRESESATAREGAARRGLRWGNWGARQRPVVTDMDGHFELTDLSPGMYTVHAARRGGGEGVVEHVEVGSDTVVAIDGGGSLSGTVTLAAGGYPERYTVNARERTLGIYASESFFRGDGEFTLEGLQPGTYELNATTPEGNASLKDVKLGAGEIKEGLVMEVSSLGSVIGRVVTMDTGQPLPNQMVIAAPDGGGFRISAADFDGGKHITDEDGRFEVELVPAGKVTLRTWARSSESDYGSVNLPVQVSAGEVLDAGDLQAPRRRVAQNERPGDLGYETRDSDPKLDWHEQTIEVAVVRPGGPAAAAGLKPGDVVKEVDGKDVTGKQRYLYRALVRAPEGTALKIGLADGRSAKLVVGPAI